MRSPTKEIFREGKDIPLNYEKEDIMEIYRNKNSNLWFIYL